MCRVLSKPHRKHFAVSTKKKNDENDLRQRKGEKKNSGLQI